MEIFELSFWHPQAGFNSQKLDDWWKLEIRIFYTKRAGQITNNPQISPRIGSENQKLFAVFKNI